MTDFSKMSDADLDVEVRRLEDLLIRAHREQNGREHDRLLSAYGEEAALVGDPYTGFHLNRATRRYEMIPCFYCGVRPGWQVEHKHPLSRGGPDTPDNTVQSCATCNRRKGTMTVEEYRAAIERKTGALHRFAGEVNAP